MKILIAPNSYKECASANQIAILFEKAFNECGLRNLIRFPISDGGDGFLDVCQEIFNLKMSEYKIKSCFNDSKIVVRTGENKKEKQIFIEIAEIIGLKTIPLSKRKPLILNSENLGIFIKKMDALRDKDKNQLKKLTIGIGGTGTSDLGLGLCVPFGLKLLDKNEKELRVVPKNYVLVKKIVLPEKSRLFIDVVLDVKIKLFGKGGTSKVFARQKGASEEEIKVLEKGVRDILNVLRHNHKLDFSEALIGAGGGLTLGLSLISKVNVITSRQFLIEKLKLPQKIASADLVISGEGKIDNQSYMEKATGIVISESIKQNKRLYLIVGINAFKGKRNKHVKIYSLTDYFGSIKKSKNEYASGINSIIKLIAAQIK